MTTISLPHDWTPRPYQLPVLKYFDAGGKRAVTVWARRHGKDSTAINHTARAAFQRVGLYWHVLPTLRQARKVVWNAIDGQGRRVIDQAFPPEIRARTRDDEMLIELANGSIYQVVGADNHDALVGSNPVGVVLSEWSIMDPKTWDFIRPILAENKGWAWFIYTPRGRNHGWDVYDSARRNPGWFAEVVDIETGGVLDVAAVLEEERLSGMPEELIKQEYYCSFDVGNVGTIFDKEIAKLELDGRITSVPYDPNYPVQTAWDLGVRDATAIWFIQHVGYEIRVIDYYEASGEGMPHFINVINSKGYAYARHIGPHDLEQREWSSGNSKRAMAAEHGLNFEVAPKLSIEDGINAVRAKLARCVFDKVKTEAGLKALRNYKRSYDEDNRVFKKDPVHDWASHGASAFRYYAVVPDLTFTTPQWLKDMAPNVFDKGRKPKLWTMQDEMFGKDDLNYDPLGEFRGELVR
jgi:phage terminase large subunit